MKKALILLLKISVSTGLLYLLLSKTGTQNVAALLGGISKPHFAAAALVYIAAQFVSSIRWRILMAERFPLSRLFPLYMMGSFFNVFLPGIVGGDAVKIYYLYRERVSGAEALASVFMDRYTGFVAIICLGIAAYPLGLVYVGDSWLAWVMPSIVAGFTVASYIVFFSPLGRSIKALRSIYEFFGGYARRRGDVLRAIGLGFIIQLMGILAVFILSRGLDLSIPPMALVVFVPIIITVSAVPLSVAGLGIREAAFTLLLGSVGIEPGQAMALSFAWFLSVAVASLIGLPEYLRPRLRR